MHSFLPIFKGNLHPLTHYFRYEKKMEISSAKDYEFHYCGSNLSAMAATAILALQEPRGRKLMYAKKMNSRKRDPKLWLHTTYTSFIQMVFPR